MSKILEFTFRYLIAAGCLYYAMRGIDLEKLWQALSAYNPYVIAAITLYSLFTLTPSVLRFKYLATREVPTRDLAEATFIGLAFNCILPAKAGELAKVLYMKMVSDIPSGEAMEMVFWERFSDLNALLLMGIAAAMSVDQIFFVLPLATVVIGVWGFLALDRMLPRFAQWVVGLVPLPRISRVLDELLAQLRTRSGLRFFGPLLCTTFLIWLFAAILTGLTLTWAGGLDLDMSQILTIFAVVTFSYVIPSTPGGIGIYEAAFVLSLSWFNVPKEEALALGFLCHALQLVPPTLCGLFVFMNTKSSFVDAFRKSRHRA